MLVEFAILPSVFDERVHRDTGTAAWFEQLRDLGREMFKRNVACPVIVANLQDGEWWNHAQRIVEQMPPGDSRRAAILSLLKQIKGVAVRRPGHLTKLVTHLDWVHETLLSHESVRFERIVACPATAGELRTTLRTRSNEVSNLSELHDDAFWDGISPILPQPLKIDEQVNSLGKICLHAGFLCLLLPHIRGESGDETDFAIRLIQKAFCRPDRYPTPLVEVHANGPQPSPSSPKKYPDRLQDVIDSIQGRLLEALKPGQQVSLTMWPAKEILDRRLLAGFVEHDSSGAAWKRPRWLVFMGHIAHKREASRRSSSTSWNLAGETELQECYNLFAAPGVTGFLPPSPIVIRK